VWPEGIPTDGSVEAAVRLFESLGYQKTDDATFTPGVEKIAIYGDAKGYTHAARQLTNGRWTSKIGKLQDIEHDSLDALTSLEKLIGTPKDRAYGRVVQILAKSVPSPSA
jgi:hypothetical protein